MTTVYTDPLFYIVWNGSATYNVFTTEGENVECFTDYGPTTTAEAVRSASAWVRDNGLI